MVFSKQHVHSVRWAIVVYSVTVLSFICYRFVVIPFCLFVPFSWSHSKFEFVMAMSVDEAQRIIRVKDRSLIKRSTCVARITAVHSLAQQASETSELTPQLLVAVGDLDALWSDFVIEDNAVIEALCDLGLSGEYSGKLSVEVCGLIIYSKSIANSYNLPTTQKWFQLI